MKSADASRHGKLEGCRESCIAAKSISNNAVYSAISDAQKGVLENIDTKSADIFRLANQTRRDN